MDIETAFEAVTINREIVSLFSGCGGMDLGFLGGFEFLEKNYPRLPNTVVWANDNNEAACNSYRENLGGHIVCGDISDCLASLPNGVDILLGGFPCQDVSVNGKRQRENGSRTILYRTMIEAIKITEPTVFVAENVRGLLSSEFGNRVLSDFNLPGYTVTYSLYLASDYGVPQRRLRLIIVGIRGDQAFVHPPPLTTFNPITCFEALDDLAEKDWCEESAHIWSKAKRSPEQGNRKLKANLPATTIRAEHHGNVQWHYSLPRRISLREQARLQSFPDDFIFCGGMRQTERQIGNAVPPVMAWHIASAIEEQVFA